MNAKESLSQVFSVIIKDGYSVILTEKLNPYFRGDTSLLNIREPDAIETTDIDFIVDAFLSHDYKPSLKKDGVVYTDFTFYKDGAKLKYKID